MNESAARQVVKERRRKSDFMAKLDASAGPTRVFAAEEGGTDSIDNAIHLCPNCHDEVHGHYAS